MYIVVYFGHIHIFVIRMKRTSYYVYVKGPKLHQNVRKEIFISRDVQHNFCHPCPLRCEEDIYIHVTFSSCSRLVYVNEFLILFLFFFSVGAKMRFYYEYKKYKNLCRHLRHFHNNGKKEDAGQQNAEYIIGRQSNI